MEVQSELIFYRPNNKKDGVCWFKMCLKVLGSTVLILLLYFTTKKEHGSYLFFCSLALFIQWPIYMFIYIYVYVYIYLLHILIWWPIYIYLHTLVWWPIYVLYIPIYVIFLANSRQQYLWARIELSYRKAS